MPATGQAIRFEPSPRELPSARAGFAIPLCRGCLIENQRLSWNRDRPVALYTRAERGAELPAAATQREAVHVVVGTSAAAAALWGISTGRDGALSAHRHRRALSPALACDQSDQSPKTAVIVAYPTFRQRGAERPAFTLRVANASAAPLVVTREDVRAFFRDRPVALYTRAERGAELPAAATQREAVHVVVGTLAAAAALWGISTGRDGALSAATQGA